MEGDNTLHFPKWTFGCEEVRREYRGISGDGIWPNSEVPEARFSISPGANRRQKKPTDGRWVKGRLTDLRVIPIITNQHPDSRDADHGLQKTFREKGGRPPPGKER